MAIFYGYTGKQTTLKINECMTLIGIMGLLRQLLKLKPWKGEILVGHGFRSQVT